MCAFFCFVLFLFILFFVTFFCNVILRDSNNLQRIVHKKRSKTKICCRYKCWEEKKKELYIVNSLLKQKKKKILFFCVFFSSSFIFIFCFILIRIVTTSGYRLLQSFMLLFFVDACGCFVLKVISLNAIFSFFSFVCAQKIILSLDEVLTVLLIFDVFFLSYWFFVLFISTDFLLHPFRKPKRVRTAFSPGQLLKLEHAFENNQYVVGAERKALAQALNLSETQVNKEKWKIMDQPIKLFYFLFLFLLTLKFVSVFHFLMQRIRQTTTTTTKNELLCSSFVRFMHPIDNNNLFVFLFPYPDFQADNTIEHAHLIWCWITSERHYLSKFFFFFLFCLSFPLLCDNFLFYLFWFRFVFILVLCIWSGSHWKFYAHQRYQNQTMVCAIKFNTKTKKKKNTFLIHIRFRWLPLDSQLYDNESTNEKTGTKYFTLDEPMTKSTKRKHYFSQWQGDRKSMDKIHSIIPCFAVSVSVEYKKLHLQKISSSPFFLWLSVAIK